jgi:uncharacterized cupin superfamily protein
MSSKTGERFSQSAVLSQWAEFQDVFIHHEIIQPGRRSSSPHCHSQKEEMILVLEGHPTAHLGSQAFQLKPGDFMGFKPSTEKLHFLENGTDFIARVLVISSVPPKDIVHYETP